MLICVQLAVIFPVNAQAQSVDPLPKTERPRPTPMIWHLNYPLNYLTLIAGAQGFGGLFTYSGSGGVSIVAYWQLFAGGTLGPLYMKINYAGSFKTEFQSVFYGGYGGVTSWYPQLNRPFQIWFTNLGSYTINVSGTVSMWFN